MAQFLPRIWQLCKMINKFLDLLFPPKCPFCHHVLKDREEGFCDPCQHRLPWCAGTAGEQKLEFLSGCVSPLFYRDHVREGVHRFKFSNCPGYAGVFGLLMFQAVQDGWKEVSFDLVTWVPLSQKGLRRRGYDQARLLAENLAPRLALPSAPSLVKRRHTTAQSLLSGESARRANVLDAYELRSGVDVRGKTILLCDDVVTTGATLSECARVLLTAGAAEVYAVTLARSSLQK